MKHAHSHLRSNRLAIAVIATLAAASIQAAPTQLSTTALDEAVAAGETSHETEGTRASVVVADQSRVDVQLRRAVELHDSTQSDAKVLNAVNGVQADVANAINVVTGGATVGRQGNEVTQLDRQGARADSIERRGVNRTSSYEQSATVDAQSASQSFNESVLRSGSRSSVVDTYNAQVPAYYPLQNLTLTLGTPSLPSVTVPAFGFDLTTTDDVGGVYGIRGGLGPFYFDPPQIVLGTVSLSGNDILIKGGYVKLPSLDLGSATIEVCVIDCGGVSVDLPTINGPKIDFGAEYRLANANPFKDVRVNAGGGLAVAGKGHVEVSLGSVRVGAEVSLDIPDLTTSFSFDVLGHEVSTGKFGVTIPPISASINLIDADIGVAYSADFDGALCLSIVTTSCQGLSHRETTEDLHAEIVRSDSSSSQSFNTSNSSQGSSITTIGARMSGAEADLIAMSEGTASMETESVVQLDAQAQRGMKVFNAVNATGTMVGNTLNVGAQRPAAASSGAFSQSNVFNQFQTRPRSR